MTITLPTGWQSDSTLPEELLGVLMASEMPWLQVVTETCFVVARLLLAEEDTEFRVAVAETIGAKLIETARSGRIAGEVMQ